MDNTGLHLSVLGGELKAVGIRKGAPTGSWECPESVTDFVGLAGVLRQAMTGTQAEGNTVSIVLAHPSLSDQVIDVPPVRGRTLARLLDRQVKSLKAFPGDPVWSHQPALSVRKGNAVLLHVCPKFVLDQLDRSSRTAGLHLSRVIPTTSVLLGQLKQLPLKKGEVALLAAETGPSTTMVIGGPDGRVCLGRVLRDSWNTEPDRVAVDLTRSIGFAEQQAGVTVTGVWLFGAGARDKMASLQAALKLPVQLSPVVYTPFYWAERLARLPEKGDGNLVSPEARQAPQRRRLLTVTSVLLLFWLVAMGVATGVLEHLRRGELRQITSLEAQIADLRNQQAELQARFADFERMKEMVRAVSDEKPPPVPEWFLGYLGQVMPDDLMATRLDVIRTNELWHVRLEGAVRPTTPTQLPEMVLTNSLNALSNSLASAPFHFRFMPGPGMAQPASAARPGLVRFPESAAPSLPMFHVAGDPRRFVIEGVMR